MFRKRAESLLADIKTLELNHSTWADAQRPATRWGRWGHWYDTCNAEDCSYSIHISDELFDAPQFAYEEGPHIGARILDHVGLRSTEVSGGFHVIHGVVTNKDFRMIVPLPARDWITSEGVYWPSLAVAFRERAKLDYYSDRHFRSTRPNRVLVQARIILEAYFTPEETPEEQAALTDFRFDCITQWSPCSSRAQLFPEADHEFEAQTKEWQQAEKAGKADTDWAPTCFPTVEIRAREAPVILVGEVVRVTEAPQPGDPAPHPPTVWMIDVHLEQVLKGKPPAPVGSTLSFPSPRTGDSKPAGQILMMGQTTRPLPGYGPPNFRIDDCGLDDPSPANLDEVRKGIEDDFGPLY